MWLHRVQYQAAGADLGAGTNDDVAKNFRTRSDQHTLPDLGVPVAGFVSCAALRDRMEHGDILSHHRRFADHDTRGMVDHQATANGGRRVNIHRKDL